MTTPSSYPGVPGPPAPPPWPPPSAPPKRPARVWDVVLTSVLLVMLAVLAAVMSFLGFFLAMAGDPCGVRTCNSELIAIGLITAVALPWLLLLIAVVVAIVQLVGRRLAFWVPLVTVPLVVGSWFLGAFIAAMGVPSG